MGFGADIILRAGAWVAGLRGSVSAVPATPEGVLALFTTGGFVLLVGRALWLRGGGGLVAALSLLLWSGAERPLLLISGDGGLTGVLGDAGRALSKPKGAGFVAKSWLEDDGDTGAQEAAFARPGFRGAKGDLTAEIAGLTLRHLTGKGAADRVAAACRTGTLVVTSADWDGAPPEGCLFFGPRQLKATGALAVYAGPRIVTSREATGDRLWNRRPAPRQRLALRQ